MKGEVALALGSALKRYRGLLRLMFLIRIDPLLRGWWLPWLVNASWLGFFFQRSKNEPTTCVLLLRRWPMIRMLDSYDDDSLQQYTRLYSSYFFVAHMYTNNVCYARTCKKKACFARTLSSRTREASDGGG
jgi:hypothetical protein